MEIENGFKKGISAEETRNTLPPTLSSVFGMNLV